MCIQIFKIIGIMFYLILIEDGNFFSVCRIKVNNVAVDLCWSLFNVSCFGLCLCSHLCEFHALLCCV